MKHSIPLLAVFAAVTLLSSCGRKKTETKPIRKNITETVFASGILVPDGQYNLTAQSEGYIVKLNFDQGDIVKTDAVLAVIENKQNDYNAHSGDALLSIAHANTLPTAPALKQVEVNIEMAKQKLKEDELQAVRYKKLYEQNSVSKLDYENMQIALENSKTNLAAQQENYNLLKLQAEQQYVTQQSQTGVNKVLQNLDELKAVVGGKVFSKQKEVGDYVRRGDVIAVIGDKSGVYAKLSVDETTISKIKIGQDVVIQLNTNKQKNYNAKITQIYSAFDDQAQSFYCKARFTDSLDFKISGTQLQSNIITSIKNNILVIPKNYLGAGNIVKVKGKDPVTVQTGFISNEWVEVTKGLDETETIIAEQ